MLEVSKHITRNDVLLPLAAAGQAPGLDGVDMSSVLRLGGASPRHEMVYNMDERNFHRGPGSTQPSWQAGLRLELQMKVREDFTVFSWLKTGMKWDAIEKVIRNRWFG